MKFEHLYYLLNYFFSFRLFFYFNLITNLVNSFFLNHFFCWKISNYADGYWFFYSNKKSLHELRYLSKNNGI